MDALVRAASAFLDTLLGGRKPSRQAAVPAAEPEPPRPQPIAWELPSRLGFENKCPVCQARFRGARICSRCGADLTSLMQLAVRAWRLRELARQGLRSGDFESAARWARAAESIQHSSSGAALGLLTVWLQTFGATNRL